MRRKYGGEEQALGYSGRHGHYKSATLATNACKTTNHENESSHS
jgi:hypothetical protein